MTRDIARSNGKDEFFICDTSSMNTDSLVSPTYPVDLTIRHETDINAPVIELSDMGHSPMYITDGIKVDFHFFQEFFPTYAAESEFCAGFDVSSNIAGFTPDCPECSQCKGDGTDKKCNQHSNWNLCEMDPGCLYNNMTKQCNSLPGNDNLPKVESTQPRGCDDGTAYCRATKHGQAACVPVIDGKCLNCKDDFVFDHPERVRICATPSGRPVPRTDKCIVQKAVNVLTTVDMIVIPVATVQEYLELISFIRHSSLGIQKVTFAQFQTQMFANGLEKIFLRAKPKLC